MPRKFSNGQFAGKQHHHGCTDCHRRYCCACETPDDDGVCNFCRSGRLGDAAIAWQPQPCCYDAAPLSPITSGDQRKAYKLAGPGPWFKCPTCARTFPCQPQKVRVA